MKLNRESQEFADLVLKYYSPKILLKQKKQKEEQQQNYEEINQSFDKVDSKTKYSIDYQKFQNYMENSDKTKPKTAEEIEIEKIIQSNPYLSQIACTHDRRKEREIYEKTNKEKFENIEYFKQEGNVAFKNKEYDKAAYFYQKALVYFDYTFPEGDQEEQKYNLLLEQCNNNMAQCKLLQGCLDEAWNYSHQALKINPKSEKAIFRQAKISYQKDDFEQCEALLQKLNQDLQETKELKLNLQNRIKLYNQRNEQVYKKMLQE
ncbi:unnamed protein product [Paramecium pentaurelia]|uniref:Tetratricopeptide repeat protein n=1 Tax=Paramecium pentaurelia TaxID=43138 RepID=A0A8S1V0B4_9CILI|nr:unnamed protein product [Paramecium pentaurelia]